MIDITRESVMNNLSSRSSSFSDNFLAPSSASPNSYSETSADRTPVAVPQNILHSFCNNWGGNNNKNSFLEKVVDEIIII